MLEVEPTGHCVVWLLEWLIHLHWTAFGTEGEGCWPGGHRGGILFCHTVPCHVYDILYYVNIPA